MKLTIKDFAARLSDETQTINPVKLIDIINFIRKDYKFTKVDDILSHSEIYIVTKIINNSKFRVPEKFLRELHIW